MFIKLNISAGVLVLQSLKQHPCLHGKIYDVCACNRRRIPASGTFHLFPVFHVSWINVTSGSMQLDRNVHREGRYLTAFILFSWRLCHQTWPLTHCDILLTVQEACNWYVTEIRRHLNADSTLLGSHSLFIFRATAGSVQSLQPFATKC